MEEIEALFNILFLADHLGYQNGVWHGRTTYLVTVLPRLIKAGHRVSACFMRGEHPAADHLRAAGIEPIFLSLSPGDPRAIWRLSSLIHNLQPDIIHATQHQSTTLARLCHLWERKPKIVIHVVDTDRVKPIVRIANYLLPQPDATICVSKPIAKTAIEEYGATPDHIHVLHNGLDMLKFPVDRDDTRRRVRAELGIDESRRVVISAARFGYEKRIEFLIPMIPRILQQAPKTLFLLAGDGPLRARCEKLADELGIRNAVRFLGHRNDIPSLMAASDIAVMMCMIEAFGHAAAEAAIMGKPVVAYDVVGMPEIVLHEKTGLLAPPDDDRQFSEHLIRLLTRPAELAAMSAEAQRDSVRFNVDEHMRKLQSLYRQIVPTDPGRRVHAAAGGTAVS